MKSTLHDVLTLEPLDDFCFRAVHHKENFQRTLFGGQVLAQALMAAGRTVTDVLPHSMHAYFLRAGTSQAPVDYQVIANRDGRSFSHRTVNAVQNGKLIFSMMASFQAEEPGFEHALSWTSVPPQPVITETQAAPELAPDQPEMKADSFEFYTLDTSMFSEEAGEPGSRFWMRATENLPKTPLLQACALAYASDFGLLATSLCEHPASLFKGKVVAASVDHALWFHGHDFSIADWLFYEIQSPWAGNARGFATCRIFSANGKLVASVSQEGLIRPNPAP
jgi:acyl-CoA thioesterase-2